MLDTWHVTGCRKPPRARLDGMHKCADEDQPCQARKKQVKAANVMPQWMNGGVLWNMQGSRTEKDHYY